MKFDSEKGIGKAGNEMDQPGQVGKSFLSGSVHHGAHTRVGAFFSPARANKSSVDGIEDSGDSSMKRRNSGENVRRRDFHQFCTAGMCQYMNIWDVHASQFSLAINPS